jgi:peptidoglycan/LPS O-acetylase OafA/YrhL
MTTESIAASGRVKLERSTVSHRIPAFDFTKGTLVLFMVLYHWLNYFYGPQGEIYKYLRFLTPSFIFITGFLISHVHFAKYGIGNAKLSSRLFVRGVKLLAIFSVLNIMAALLEPMPLIRDILLGRAALVNLGTIFVTGVVASGPSGKIAVFTILVPIGYLLILSSLLSIACRYFKYSFHAVCALSLVCMVLLGLHGVQSANLELLAMGLLGVVFGYASPNKIQQLVSHPWVIASAYCVYLVAITIWPVSLYEQMVGACLTTALIYVVGARAGEPGRLLSHIVLLGRYSLFGYIAQIAILQALRMSLMHVNCGPVILAASFVAGLVLTMISVEAVDRGRALSKTIDGAYRAVFA